MKKILYAAVPLSFLATVLLDNGGIDGLFDQVKTSYARRVDIKKESDESLYFRRIESIDDGSQGKYEKVSIYVDSIKTLEQASRDENLPIEERILLSSIPRQGYPYEVSIRDYGNKGPSIGDNYKIIKQENQALLDITLKDSLDGRVLYDNLRENPFDIAGFHGGLDYEQLGYLSSHLTSKP